MPASEYYTTAVQVQVSAVTNAAPTFGPGDSDSTNSRRAFRSTNQTCHCRVTVELRTGALQRQKVRENADTNEGHDGGNQNQNISAVSRHQRPRGMCCCRLQHVAPRRLASTDRAALAARLIYTSREVRGPSFELLSAIGLQLREAAVAEVGAPVMQPSRCRGRAVIVLHVVASGGLLQQQ